METRLPAISLIIPAFNRPELLSKLCRGVGTKWSWSTMVRKTPLQRFAAISRRGWRPNYPGRQGSADRQWKGRRCGFSILRETGSSQTSFHLYSVNASKIGYVARKRCRDFTLGGRARILWRFRFSVWRS